MKLILASSSPFRCELLSRLMIPFEVVVPDVDETSLQHESPQALVERLAILKAQTVASKHADALVIGSDQVAVHNGEIVGKPLTHERAVDQLKSASGKTVLLYTGLALVNSSSGRVQSEVVPYGVTFRTLTELQIETYLRKEQPYHCAGSVKSEGLGVALLERFDGEDPATLIGLPLIRLIRLLENEGLAVI
jgi:septum formation protein